MSSSDFHIQVKELEDELNKAEQNIYRLEKEQREQITRLEEEYKSKLGHAGNDLFRFIKCISDIDSLLLEEYSNAREDKELETYLDESEDTIVSLNRTLGQSFEGLEDCLVRGKKQLTQDQEKAVEEGTSRMGILNGKITDTQDEIKRQIKRTESDIDVSNREKSDAERRRSELQRGIKDLERRLSQLHERNGVVIGTTIGGGALAVFGALLTPVFPPAGLGMVAAGSSMAIGSGVAIGDTQGKINATRNDIGHTNDNINRLRQTIESLAAKVPQLRADLGLFDGLVTKVKCLSEKSNTLYHFVHEHVTALTAAKDSISIGENKIKELGADLQGLGYAGTRGELAQKLETVIEKFRDGRSQLEGGADPPEMGRMLLMVGDLAGDTDEVLAIMDSI
ncbi:hypothetical protein TWF730_006247 [Orbilia blumenaviensis]|uniref:Uncharacterized protein n=1 Tax=Orbilia blumenaviensis TaxID=1796055 RepID=A0AAV9VG90_9PEZI